MDDSSTVVQNNSNVDTIFRPHMHQDKRHGPNIAQINIIKEQIEPSSPFLTGEYCSSHSFNAVKVNNTNLSFYETNKSDFSSVGKQRRPIIITSTPLPTISVSTLSSAETHQLLNDRIHRVVQTCRDRMRHVNPKDFLQFLLESRGYNSSYIEALTERRSMYRCMSTAKQVEDYDCSVVEAVRLSELHTLQRLSEEGKSMSACNRFSESIFHLACRRSSYQTVRFMLSKVDTVFLVDDYGRTPLHDACWRIEPHFDIVALLMDATVDLIRCKDKRGAIPLDYVREEHWPLWCVFLDIQKDKYWPDIKKMVT